MNDDEQHLNLLAIFHYVVAGITALGGCFPIIHLGVGIAILSGSFRPEPNDPAATTFIGWMFTGIAGAIIIVMWSLAIVVLIGGRCLHQRRRPTFCLVVAGLECVLVPFGTVLGVFTIIVLLRPSVRQLFGEQDGSAVAGG
ncbi:MAG: hypothetical protein HY290_19550 [Planctomycetia bacterium]|nr:hypothetical protein [Planctomycetia bacterium]